MLYLCNWQGEETDWITLTPQDPQETDSQEFDEGTCTGFKIPKDRSELFISGLLRHCTRFNIEVTRRQ